MRYFGPCAVRRRRRGWQLGALVTATMTVLSAAQPQASLDAEPPHGGSIEVVVDGLRSDRGELRFGLFANAASFPFGKTMRNGAARIENGRAHFTIDSLPYGDYALAVAHDVNGDGKIALSPWSDELKGISNHVEKVVTPPDWDDARFVLTQETLQVTLRVY